MHFGAFAGYIINLNISAGLVYILLHLIRPQFIGSDILKKSATLNIRIFIFAVALAFFCELIFTYQTYYLTSSAIESEYQIFINNDRLFGKYWYGYWGNSLFYLLTLILIFINPIKQSYFFSFLVMLMSQAIFILQRFIIISTSSHKDFIPSSLSIYINWKQFLLTTCLPGLIYSFVLILIINRRHIISNDKS